MNKTKNPAPKQKLGKTSYQFCNRTKQKLKSELLAGADLQAWQVEFLKALSSEPSLAESIVLKRIEWECQDCYCAS